MTSLIKAIKGWLKLKKSRFEITGIYYIEKKGVHYLPGEVLGMNLNKEKAKQALRGYEYNRDDYSYSSEEAELESEISTSSDKSEEDSDEDSDGESEGESGSESEGESGSESEGEIIEIVTDDEFEVSNENMDSFYVTGVGSKKRPYEFMN